MVLQFVHLVSYTCYMPFASFGNSNGTQMSDEHLITVFLKEARIK